MLEQIEVDLKAALLAGESLKVEVLRGLKNSINNLRIEQKRDVTEDEAVKIAQKEIKKRIEAAEIYSKAGAQERATKENDEAVILGAYLPDQLSELEIEAIVDEIIASNNIDSPQKMGMAMGLATKQIGARADGATIAIIVKKKLGV